MMIFCMEWIGDRYMVLVAIAVKETKRLKSPSWQYAHAFPALRR